MDKGQQGQLVQAWLSALHSSALSCWQAFLGDRTTLQVMHEYLCGCWTQPGNTPLLLTTDADLRGGTCMSLQTSIDLATIHQKHLGVCGWLCYSPSSKSDADLLPTVSCVIMLET